MRWIAALHVGHSISLLDDLVVDVFPVTRDDVGAAGLIAEQHDRLSARDCLHLAVMSARRVNRILTFDEGFDHYPGIMRLP